MATDMWRIPQPPGTVSIDNLTLYWAGCSAYIVFDTQLLIQRFDMDDYIWAVSWPGRLGVCARRFKLCLIVACLCGMLQAITLYLDVLVSTSPPVTHITHALLAMPCAHMRTKCMQANAHNMHTRTRTHILLTSALQNLFLYILRALGQQRD